MKRSFAKLANHMDLIFRKKLWFVMLEQFLMKYIWGLAGLVMVAWPIISGKVFDWTVSLSIGLLADGFYIHVHVRVCSVHVVFRQMLII